MRKNIILLNDFDITKRPRPFRMLEMLKGHYNLFAIAKECSVLSGITTFSYPGMKNAKQRNQQEQQELEKQLKNKNFLPLIYTPNRLKILDFFSQIPPADLLIVEDITLLAFAIDYKKKYHSQTKILIDLREYYPLEYDNNPSWKESFGEFFNFICKTYLKKVDFAISVSEEIAKKYQQEFHIDCHVFYSLPPYHHLTPSPTKKTIDIVYHGFLSPDRNSHILLEIAKDLRKDFRIYILGLSNQANYLNKLKKQAPKNITFLKPIKMQELIAFTNHFDIGILTLSPNTFNNTYAMPNKFFEYIQARLAVISTPLPSLKDFINKWGIGITSEDFYAKSITQTLNALTIKQIQKYKNASHLMAKILNTQINEKQLLQWLQKLL